VGGELADYKINPLTLTDITNTNSMKQYFFIIALLVLSTSISCTSEKKAAVTTPALVKLAVTDFGTMPDGIAVKAYTLKNSNDVEMTVINYGGIIVSLKTPDRNGAFDDIVLGYDSLSGYIKSSPYFGALIGRYGNRIANGKFSLDGVEYKLAQNNDANHLHGGIKGFDKVFWEITPGADSTSLLLTYKSADGEEGYPGNLSVEVTYTLTDNNELKIDYKATTDKPTIVNLTQHSYFNLAGSNAKDILGHTLVINADAFLPVDKTLIPTGERRAVKGTPFDFTTPHLIGERINEKDQQLQFGLGYDHCWVLNNNYDSATVSHVATLSDSTTGRVLEVYTNEPGLQFYSGNFLDGTLKGKTGKVYEYRSGLCLETQHFPDSPNKKDFPSVVLLPGQTYTTSTMYSFLVK
jgi:aldose 1-epimerase